MGFEDWRAFCNSDRSEKQLAEVSHEESKDQRIETSEKKARLLPKVVFMLAVSLLSGLSIYYIFSKKEATNKYSFASKTIQTEGLPNSVIFDYDASAAGENDSVFIAQTWDVRRKVPVSRTDKHHSTIYYYPGYFKAKLLVGSKIVKEHDIQIKTNGWLGLIAADWGKEPFYFKQNEIIGAGKISVSQALLQKYNIPTLPELPSVRLFNQKDIHGIQTDHFTYETELKSDHIGGGNNSCQRVEVLLHSKTGILIVPLVHPACVGDISLAAYGFYTDSQSDDLSGFGCNLNDWVKLKVVCINRRIQFLVNGREAYKTIIADLATEIVGVQYRFRGPAAVRNTRLQGKSGSQVVF
ncbi:hypothetical protein [Dyadobacter alkalitolerans]|uniref:hypothetical protein n=1 Tax=Dyadobacter alkalitolerans TaxID=492736 RepID=UPI0012FBE1F3|nr:hypothetical protein [Dyadobacter alkalitolerans]